MIKWNAFVHKYEEYEVPDDWNCKSYSNNMDEVVNCAKCGRKMLYGDSYTSLEIHTDMGFGYAVCSRCYQGEMKRRRLGEIGE